MESHSSITLSILHTLFPGGLPALSCVYHMFFSVGFIVLLLYWPAGLIISKLRLGNLVAYFDFFIMSCFLVHKVSNLLSKKKKCLT